MTIDINHAEGLGTALPPISPEVESFLPSKVIMKFVVGGAAHESRGVIVSDQGLIAVPTDSIVPFPPKAIGADEFSQVGANWVFDAFSFQV